MTKLNLTLSNIPIDEHSQLTPSSNICWPQLSRINWRSADEVDDTPFVTDFFFIFEITFADKTKRILLGKNNYHFIQIQWNFQHFCQRKDRVLHTCVSNSSSIHAVFLLVEDSWPFRFLSCSTGGVICPWTKVEGRNLAPMKSSTLIDFKVLQGVYNQLNCW